MWPTGFFPEGYFSPSYFERPSGSPAPPARSPLFGVESRRARLVRERALRLKKRKRDVDLAVAAWLLWEDEV